MKKLFFILLSFLFIVVNSCNEDDDIIENIIPEAQDGTALISAIINENEIGGNNLVVSSIFYPDAPINNGVFNTIVSQVGTQIVLITDDDNSLRGLSYTIKEGNTYKLAPVDAVSTVNSIFLLTAGMTTTSPIETVELINKLESLPSYIKFQTEIKNNLINYNLAELLTQSTIQDLFESVVLEYLELDSKKSQEKKDFYGERLTVLKNGDGKVEISNSAFRYVNVYRSYLDNEEINNTQLVTENMSGGIGVSWGSLFTLSTFEPTIKVDENYLPPTQTTETEYWVIGAGMADVTEIPPSYINTNYNEAFGKTCIYYVAFPIMDIFCGSTGLMDKQELVSLIWNDFKDIDKLIKLSNASSSLEFNRLLINLSFSIVKSALTNPSVVSTLGITSGAAATLGTFSTILSIVMSSADISVFTADYIKQPKYSKFIIGTPLNPPVLLSPANNSQEDSPNVTFSWEKNPLAWKYIVEISENSDFEDKIIKTTDGITTTLTLTLEPSTLYYWRVYCTKGDGSPSETSDVWTFTTGEDSFSGESGTFVDERDGHVYEWVKIGEQIWMAENLDYATSNSVYYNNNEATYKEYGRLYTYEDALTACPEGWHLPSYDEFLLLLKTIEPGYNVEIVGSFNSHSYGVNSGNILKEVGTVHWSSPNNGTDEFNFKALPGGWQRFNNTSFQSIGDCGNFWSSTESPNVYNGISSSWTLSLWDYKNNAELSQMNRPFKFSIRAIKD